MKEFWLVIFGFIVVIALAFGVKLLFFDFNAYDKSVDMAYDVVNDTLSSENAIDTYEWFKEQEAYIRQCYTNEEIALEEWNVFKDSLTDDRESWSNFDAREESSLRGSYYALQKLTNKAIEDYNAESSKANKSIFKDNLPSNISRAFYTANELINQ